MSIIYFVLASVSWGLGWYAAKIHALSEVASEQSIGYRFLLASFLLYIFCRVRNISLSHTWREHLVLAGQGICMCSMNFYFSYLATQYISSGLVSIVCSTLVFMNVINNSLFFKSQVSLKMLLGGCIGFCGIFLVFEPHIAAFQTNQNGMMGLIFGLVGTYIASLGNALVKYNNITSQKNVFQNLTFVMFYGGIFSLCMSLGQGKLPTISLESDYISALFYLAIFSSLIGFASYLKLIDLIGSEKAAYTMMVSPIIALIVSSFMEGLNLTFMTMIGSALTLLGSIIVLMKFERKTDTQGSMKKAA